MTIEQSALLQLIKQSQFDIPADIAWDKIDMQVLYNEASQQTVLGLVAPLIPEEYTNDTWRKATLQQESAYIRYCFAQDDLKRILDEAGIPFAILKGNAAAIYYKEPMRRAMGDIDFIVPIEQFSKAKAILSSYGYKEDHLTYRHVSFHKGKMSYELHHRFSHKIDFENYIIEGLHSLEFTSIDGHEFPILPRLPNGIVLLDHIREHIKTGIGLRQIIDWMMYVHCNLDDSYWEKEFGRIANEKRLDTLALTATRMCQIYLGLSTTITWCNKADDDTCQQLLELLFLSGNFGHKNGKGNYIEAVSTSIKEVGLFPWLQHAGETSWSAYHKHHWLKPFCWLYQICRYAKKGLKSGRNSKQIQEDLNRSSNRYNLLNKLNIK